MMLSATDYPSSLASSCVHWTTLSKTDQTTFCPLCPRLIKPQSAHFVQDWSNHNLPTLSKTDQTTFHPLCPRLIKPHSAHFVQDWSNHIPPTLSKTDQTTFHPLCPRLIKPHSAHFVQDWSNHNLPTLSKTDQTTIHYPMHFLRAVIPPTLVMQPLKPFWRERWNARYCFPAKGKMHEWRGANWHARIGAKRTDIIELTTGNSTVLFWHKRWAGLLECWLATIQVVIVASLAHAWSKSLVVSKISRCQYQSEERHSITE